MDQTSQYGQNKRMATVNPKRMDRIKYAGYLDIDPSAEYSGFFKVAHAPSGELSEQG